MEKTAMLFYTADFLADAAMLSMKERGQYITLYCLQQREGRMSMETVRKAVGRLSDAVLSMLETDENGLLYISNLEKQIEKKALISQKRRESVMTRWCKKGDSGNTNALQTQCNCFTNVDTNVDTNVLQEHYKLPPSSPLPPSPAFPPHTPPYHSLPSTPYYPPSPPSAGTTTFFFSSSEESEAEEKTAGTADKDGGIQGGETPGSELGRVMSAYMDKISAMPSTVVAAEIKAFLSVMSADAVLHAIDYAVDERKYSWSYIRAILRDYKRRGLTSLEDVLRSEQEYDERKEAKAHGRADEPDSGGGAGRWGIVYDVGGEQR